jgi:hypothetical protein
MEGHWEHILEEHGMSCRRYSSRTIFWTLPLFVDLTKTLLEILAPWGPLAADLFRLVISKENMPKHRHERG